MYYLTKLDSRIKIQPLVIYSKAERVIYLQFVDKKKPHQLSSVSGVIIDIDNDSLLLGIEILLPINIEKETIFLPIAAKEEDIWWKISDDNISATSQVFYDEKKKLFYISFSKKTAESYFSYGQNQQKVLLGVGKNNLFTNLYFYHG